MSQKTNRFRRSKRLRVVETRGDDPTWALQAELTLLREENARLQTEQYRRPSLGTVLEQARVLADTGTHGEDAADEAAQMLADGLVVRESLLKVCREMIQSMCALEVSLITIAADSDREGLHADGVT